MATTKLEHVQKLDECERRFGIMRRNGGMNCQDCGNQAKKNCIHLRCRTCKS